MDIYDTVKFDTPLGLDSINPNYCPEFLYWFSFGLVIFLWVLVALSLTCGLLAKFCNCFYNLICCRPCKQAEANRV